MVSLASYCVYPYLIIINGGVATFNGGGNNIKHTLDGSLDR